MLLCDFECRLSRRGGCRFLTSASITVGQKVKILGLGEILESVCTSVEAFNAPMAQGEAGQNVGLLLRGIKGDQIRRGQVIAARARCGRGNSSKVKSTF